MFVKLELIIDESKTKTGTKNVGVGVIVRGHWCFMRGVGRHVAIADLLNYAIWIRT